MSSTNKDLFELTSEQTAYVQRALKTAQLFKCDKLVIERELFRGMNDDFSMIIIDNTVPPGLPFAGMGILEVSKLVARLNLVPNPKIFVTTSDHEEAVTSITIKGGGATVKHACTRFQAVKTLRSYEAKDEWTIDFSPDAVAQLAKASSAMGTDNIGVVSEGGKCKFVIKDGPRNEYEQEFDGNIQFLEDEDYDDDDDDDVPNKRQTLPSFNFLYRKDMFLIALKYADEAVNGEEGSEARAKNTKSKVVRVEVGPDGMMKVMVNNITVRITHIMK